jgi:hypothetical protein
MRHGATAPRIDDLDPEHSVVAWRSWSSLALLEMRSWIALVWLFSVIVQNHALKQLSAVLVSGMARVRPEVTR